MTSNDTNCLYLIRIEDVIGIDFISRVDHRRQRRLLYDAQSNSALVLGATVDGVTRDNELYRFLGGIEAAELRRYVTGELKPAPNYTGADPYRRYVVMFDHKKIPKTRAKNIRESMTRIREAQEAIEREFGELQLNISKGRFER